MHITVSVNGDSKFLPERKKRVLVEPAHEPWDVTLTINCEEAISSLRLVDTNITPFT